MIDSYLRNSYQTALVNPLVKFKCFQKINPTFITLLAVIFGLATLPLLIYGKIYYALFCFLTSGYLDTLDGSIARAYSKSSEIGAVMDIVSDRLTESCIIIGLFLVEPNMRALSCLIMFTAILLCITSFLVVGIFSKNDSAKSFYYSPGIIERTEAFCFFALMMLFPSMFFLLSYSFSILVAITCLHRLWQFNKQR